MPTLSQYWFQHQLFSGPFTEYNLPFACGQWAWITETGSSGATLDRVRPDNEIVVDLGPLLNAGDVLSTIDGILAGQANRTSNIRAAGVFWGSVPYHDANPARHNPGDMLARVSFDFHIGTPWYCSDADGTIDYYLFLFLNGSRHIQGYVDGWHYHFNGGSPFCSGAISDALNQAVPAGIPQVQNILTSRLELLSGSTFSALYYLPGSGRKDAGGHSEDADQDVAIAVLP